MSEHLAMDSLNVANLLGFLYVGASDPYRPGVGRKGEVGHPMPFDGSFHVLLFPMHQLTRHTPTGQCHCV